MTSPPPPTRHNFKPWERISTKCWEQLGEELEKLGIRKTALENERAGLNKVAGQVGKEQIEKSVRDYCEEAAKGIFPINVTVPAPRISIRVSHASWPNDADRIMSQIETGVQEPR